MGRLTWEQARALVERGYNPYQHLDPSIRIVKLPSVESPEAREFGEQFLRKLRQRLQSSNGE